MERRQRSQKIYTMFLLAALSLAFLFNIQPAAACHECIGETDPDVC